MKIAMHPPESVSSRFQFPSPVNTLMLDVGKQIVMHNLVTRRVAVDESHNAFRMSDEFPDAASVQFRIAAFDRMYLHEIIAKSIGPGDVNVRQPGTATHPREVFDIAMALGVFRKNEKLFGVSDRNRRAVAAKHTHIHGANMAWQ